jgi:hypothetical protein
MKIVVKKVDEEPMVVEKDEVTLSDMQEMVGGFIECIHVGGKIDMWINDMGKLLDMPINIVLHDESDILDTIHGDIFFAGGDASGDLIGLTDGEITWIKNKLSYGCVVELQDDPNAYKDPSMYRLLPAWVFDPTVS